MESYDRPGKFLVFPMLDRMLTSQNESLLHLSRIEGRQKGETEAEPQPERPENPDTQSTFLEPTQKLSDVKSLALFPD